MRPFVRETLLRYNINLLFFEIVMQCFSIAMKEVWFFKENCLSDKKTVYHGIVLVKNLHFVSNNGHIHCIAKIASSLVLVDWGSFFLKQSIDFEFQISSLKLFHNLWPWYHVDSTKMVFTFGDGEFWWFIKKRQCEIILFLVMSSLRPAWVLQLLEVVVHRYIYWGWPRQKGPVQPRVTIIH